MFCKLLHKILLFVSLKKIPLSPTGLQFCAWLELHSGHTEGQCSSFLGANRCKYQLTECRREGLDLQKNVGKPCLSDFITGFN